MTFPSAMVTKLTILMACALALALLIHDRNRWKSTATLRQRQVVAEKAAHAATVANYRAAAERARRADAANAARVKAGQAAINERTAHDYETRIAAARAASGRLHGAPAAPADPRGGRAAAMPALPAPAQGAAQATGQDRLPDDRLTPTEQAIQLDELIKWVRQQHAIRVDGMSGERPQAAVEPSRE